MSYYGSLARRIDAVDFGHVFCIDGGEVVDHDGNEYAPSVYHDEDTDITIDGAGWSCLTGYTGQYGYHGAVMHSSEHIGACIAEDMAEQADTAAEDGIVIVFAIVTVEVLPDEDDEDAETDLAGWAIAYKEVTTHE